MLGNVLDNFGNISGLKLYHAKYTVLRSDTLKNCNVTCCKKKTFIWASESATTLGNLKNNLGPKIKEFNTCLKPWS